MKAEHRNSRPRLEAAWRLEYDAVADNNMTHEVRASPFAHLDPNMIYLAAKHFGRPRRPINSEVADDKSRRGKYDHESVQMVAPPPSTVCSATFVRNRDHFVAPQRLRSGVSEVKGGFAMAKAGRRVKCPLQRIVGPHLVRPLTHQGLQQGPGLACAREQTPPL